MNCAGPVRVAKTCYRQNRQLLMRTFDRYLIRESIGPFFLPLGVFTFVLAVRPMLEQAESLLAKGVPVQTVAFLLMTLLPQALGITLPMAFLAGLLMAFGRLSGDRDRKSTRLNSSHIPLS